MISQKPGNVLVGKLACCFNRLPNSTPGPQGSLLKAFEGRYEALVRLYLDFLKHPGSLVQEVLVCLLFVLWHGSYVGITNILGF